MVHELVAEGDRILALTIAAPILIRANKEKLDVLDRRKLTDEETWAHLAVAGGGSRLFAN